MNKLEVYKNFTIPIINKRVLVLTLSLQHFRYAINDLAGLGSIVYKKNEREFVINNILFTYVSSARSLRGLRNFEGVEYWYGAHFRNDIEELKEIISIMRESK